MVEGQGRDGSVLFLFCRSPLFFSSFNNISRFFIAVSEKKRIFVVEI